MRTLFILVGVVAAAYYSYTTLTAQPPQPVVAQAASETNDQLIWAFEARQSKVQVQASGIVEKILSDDNQGSRHQRFILRVRSNQTVLIAHNIDIAPRVAPLIVGDKIQFSGEYAWNKKGGVVHWTHRDPKQGHVAGWIRRDGQTFQ